MLMDFLGKDAKDQGVVVSREGAPVAGTVGKVWSVYPSPLNYVKAPTSVVCGHFLC